MNPLIGLAPPDWQEFRLDDVCRIQAGPSAYRPTDQASRGISMIIPKCVQDGRILAEHCLTVSAEAATRLGSRYLLAAGDIVFTRVGDGRRHALAGHEHTGWLLGSACVSLRPRTEVLPGYLNHYLRQPAVQQWLTRSVTGAVVPTVAARSLRDLPLVLPPEQTQRAITKVLDALDEKIAAHHEIIQTTEKLRHTLAPALLTGAIPLPSS